MKTIRIDKLRSAVNDPGSAGFTLFELVVTLAVLAVLVVGTIPLSQNAIKRQKEMRLRETLRMIRGAIDEFKRDTVGSCPQGAITTGNPIEVEASSMRKLFPVPRGPINKMLLASSHGESRPSRA